MTLHIQLTEAIAHQARDLAARVSNTVESSAVIAALIARFDQNRAAR